MARRGLCCRAESPGQFPRLAEVDSSIEKLRRRGAAHQLAALRPPCATFRACLRFPGRRCEWPCSCFFPRRALLPFSWLHGPAKRKVFHRNARGSTERKYRLRV
jgi:hypothetical protein